MELDLQIIKDPCRDFGKQRVRVFGEEGGTIGRAPDCYWLLPDPKRYLSGRHCVVELRATGFWLTDTSRNGVYINGSKEPIGFGHKVQLHDGDRLQLGLYEVAVRLRERGLEREHRVPPSREHHREHESVADLVRAPEDLGAKTVTLLDPQSAQSGSDTGEHPIDARASVSDTGEHPQVGTGDGALEPSEQAPTEAASSEHAPPEEAPSELATLESTGEKPVLVPVPIDDQPEPPPSVKPARVVKIDRDALRALGHLPPTELERLVTNQFRHIKRSLLANAIGRGGAAVTNGHLIMLTSALPGEGKTFSTINLALSLAREKDLEVVIVDADSAKQHISSILGVEREPGLLDVLLDDSLSVESVILPTDVKGLSILPAGHRDEDVATELLASSRMEDIVARIGARNSRRIAIFDSSPLLLTNESRVLAAVVGQVVLVVGAGMTPQQAVEEAISYIGEDKPIGVILNQSKASSPGSYYGYGAYGYGAYGGGGSSHTA